MVNPNFDASFSISLTVMQKIVALVFLLQHVTKWKNIDRRTITLLLVSCTSTYNSIHMETGKFIQLCDTNLYKTSNTNTVTSKPSPFPKANNNYNPYKKSNVGSRMKNISTWKKQGCPQERHPANSLSFYAKFYFKHLHYYTAIAIQHMERKKSLKQISPKQLN